MPPSTQIAPPALGGNNNNINAGSVLSFYRGKNIFLTGATGFMGKVLLEKLLRTCPDVGTIYILIRTKKGQLPEKRAQGIFESSFFAKLREVHPKFYHQVSAVAGDCSLPGLGLSEEDRRTLTNNVHIIFHCAATVRFDEVLDVAVNINVRGTKCILDLAKETKNIKAVMQVSTAYANCPRSEIDEVLYDVPLDCDRVIQLTNAADEKVLNTLSPVLIGDWPNSYAYTKALGENVIKLHHGDLPMAVFRPAIVISSAGEPIPGWIDNLYGPGGVVLGTGSGLIHTLNADPEKIADLVPVDYAVNALLAAAWETANTTPEERSAQGGVTVYNYVSSVENPLVWGKFMELTRKWGLQFPSNQAVWAISLTLCRNRMHHLLLTALLHFLPALFVDAACFAIGSRFRLVKIYKKIFRFSDVISYFATREWKFRNDRVQALWQKLGPQDRQHFLFDMRSLDWDDYYYHYILGMREHMFKEDPSTITQGRQRQRRLKWLHQVMRVLVLMLALRACWALLSFAWVSESWTPLSSNNTLCAENLVPGGRSMATLRQWRWGLSSTS